MPDREQKIRYVGDASSIKRTLAGIDDDHRKLSSALGRAGADFAKLGAAAVKGAAVVGGAVATGFAFAAKKGFEMNESLETSTLQFETLMGSADQAKAHVKSLFDFAARTPFETQPIIEASRHLLTLGGTALNTEDNLKRVGDAAAATSQQINEVAFWIGRAYSSIQAGRPFGEAAARLQEMGILSAAARNRLEDMQKQGASAAEVWGVFTGELDRFNGAMLKQADSWKGLKSTMADVIALNLGTIFEPLFQSTKKATGALLELTGTTGFKEWVDGSASSLESIGKRLEVFAADIQSLRSDLETFGFTNIGDRVITQADIDAVRDKIEQIRQLIVLGFSYSTEGGVFEITATRGSFIAELVNDAFDAVIEILPQRAQDLATLVVTVLSEVEWAPLSQMFSDVLVTTFTNLDYASIILAMVKAANQIVSGLAMGLIDAVMRDPWEFIELAVTIIATPSRWLRGLTAALAKIPIIGPLGAWFIGAIDRILPDIGGKVLSSFEIIGRHIVDGLFKGLRGRWDDLIRWLSASLDNMVKWVRRVLDMRSPSRIFEDIGENVMLGFQRGLESLVPTVPMPQFSGLRLGTFAPAGGDSFAIPAGGVHIIVVNHGFIGSPGDLALELVDPIHQALQAKARVNASLRL